MRFLKFPDSVIYNCMYNLLLEKRFSWWVSLQAQQNVDHIAFIPPDIPSAILHAISPATQRQL
ncbi:MAG: hypothetical protein D3919_08565 [Candidatus Electrothrix sp. AW5]|nr:hypothetical protein [Candidatus Electrothrix gigas]MCI5196267.1 hypothetical protein [Candidatus Electrothrix gigas]